MTEEKEILEESMADILSKAKAQGIPEALSEVDRLTLELAKMHRKVALANAEKTLAQNDTAEISYKYLLLKLYVKYGLDPEKDVLHENGNILRNYHIENPGSGSDE